MRITAVTCVKNEGPFLIEWIAYNRLIGVTDFLFYSNDCTDGTDTLLDALADRGIVKHLPNPAEGRAYQMEALKDARKHKIVRKADWVWVSDVDEFLNIHVGGGSIGELIAACGNPHAISVTFQFFANDGIEAFRDNPVISQFTRTHNPDIWTDQTAIEVKTLFRRDFPLSYIGAHRPFIKKDLAKEARPYWTDGAGREVQWKFRAAANKNRMRKFPARGAREFATLNHYALRSLDSYIVKNDRGDVNREQRAFDDSYWRERNDGGWQESSIKRHLTGLKKEIKALTSDPETARLHKECVAKHREKINELMAQEEYQAMRAQLLATTPIGPAEQKLLDEVGLA